MMRYRGYQDKALTYSAGGCRLRALNDSWKLHKIRLYCTCLSYSSVCYNQMHVGIEYL